MKKIVLVPIIASVALVGCKVEEKAPETADKGQQVLESIGNIFWGEEIPVKRYRYFTKNALLITKDGDVYLEKGERMRLQPLDEFESWQFVPPEAFKKYQHGTSIENNDPDRYAPMFIAQDHVQECQVDYMKDMEFQYSPFSMYTISCGDWKNDYMLYAPERRELYIVARGKDDGLSVDNILQSYKPSL
ncbi:hypothetical protein [Neptuniibacter sp. QD37_11]|uniref:hypothetical protein n=1 Tax=Neptuniibacter sp. QD37_11 TaxID=3398209 RepID=UPI0039F5D1A8